MKEFTAKSLLGIKFLVLANFYTAVIVLVGGSLLSVSSDFSIFEFNSDLYGALDNNLQMMMVYLAVTEAVIVGYSLFTKSHQLMIAVGFFLILMIGSIEFYGEINTIAIDSNFYLFFLYTGVSHMLFGVMATLGKPVEFKNHSDNVHE
ncbi:hypothetical protein JCM14076_04240 [Methylosoma difficile]